MAGRHMTATRCAGLVALVITISIARAADDDAAKKDMARLQGEWVMVSGSADGQEMPAGILKNSKRVCKDDVTTVTVGDQLFMKAKFTLDRSKHQACVDYENIAGSHAGRPQVGIFELSGDTLRVCMSAPGKPRPQDFSSKRGDGRSYTTWRRLLK